ncbi:HlyD family secretion protein [gamma proteobacterium HdN1]|nr:HlyD family secretion protein [gamma proteobacterium HdN1]
MIADRAVPHGNTINGTVSACGGKMKNKSKPKTSYAVRWLFALVVATVLGASLPIAALAKAGTPDGGNDASATLTAAHNKAAVVAKNGVIPIDAKSPLERGKSQAIATVEYRSLDATFGSEAVIEAERQSTVSAQVAGRVLEINYRPGDQVPANAVIMRIDPRMAEQEVEGMDARINEARVNLDNTRRQYQRVNNLFKEKYVSQADYDRADAAFKAAQAQLKTLLASRGQAETSAEYATISAPYGGVMSELHVEVGEMAVPGKPLATGFDPNDLRATSRVPQAFIDQVRASHKAWVETAPGKPWLEARRIVILPAADPRTHDTEVRVYLPQNSGDWMPGQFVQVHFVTGVERKLVVPQAAILQRSELTAVYVLNQKDEPRLRQIRVGEIQPDGLREVLAGIRAGERISLNPVAATEYAH